MQNFLLKFRTLFFVIISVTAVLGCKNQRISTDKQISVRDYGAKGNGKVDDTKAIQKALKDSENRILFFPKGTYLIRETLAVPSNSHWLGEGGAKIKLYRSGIPLVSAQNKSNLTFEKIQLIGPGIYDNKWTNSGSRKERGFDFFNVSNLTIKQCGILNFGLGGIYIDGGTNVSIVKNKIEGTELLGTKLKQMDNYQFGVIIVCSKGNTLNSIKVEENDISYTNQGILTSQGTSAVAKKIELNRNVVHDIIGQHGFYLSTSNTDIIGNQVYNCGLDGIKVQAANCSVENIVVKNNVVKNCVNSQGFNITEINEGENQIQNVIIQDNETLNCGRGINLSGKIKDITIRNLKIDGTTREMGFNIQTYDLENARIEGVEILNTERSGIYINTQYSKNIQFNSIDIVCQDANSKYAPVRIIKGSGISFDDLDIENSKFSKSILNKGKDNTFKNVKINGKPDQVGN